MSTTATVNNNKQAQHHLGSNKAEGSSTVLRSGSPTLSKIRSDNTTAAVSVLPSQDNRAQTAFDRAVKQGDASQQPVNSGRKPKVNTTNHAMRNLREKWGKQCMHEYRSLEQMRDSYAQKIQSMEKSHPDYYYCIRQLEEIDLCIANPPPKSIQEAEQNYNEALMHIESLEKDLADNKIHLSMFNASKMPRDLLVENQEIREKIKDAESIAFDAEIDWLDQIRKDKGKYESICKQQNVSLTEYRDGLAKECETASPNRHQSIQQELQTVDFLLNLPKYGAAKNELRHAEQAVDEARRRDIQAGKVYTNRVYESAIPCAIGSEEELELKKTQKELSAKLAQAQEELVIAKRNERKAGQIAIWVTKEL